jgi:catechol 2,3-dioxygenase-like lactoylglutathione lyase family enzyme
MIDHISIGVKDLARARRFYDAALKPLGYSCVADFPGALGYGAKHPKLWVMSADHPVPPDEKSGLHICLEAGTHKAVDEFHSGALGAGGRDHGKPGIRKDYGDNYYAAFAIDPDGYRIEAYCGKK